MGPYWRSSTSCNIFHIMFLFVINFKLLWNQIILTISFCNSLSHFTTITITSDLPRWILLVCSWVYSVSSFHYYRLNTYMGVTLTLLLIFTAVILLIIFTISYLFHGCFYMLALAKYILMAFYCTTYSSFMPSIDFHRHFKISSFAPKRPRHHHFRPHLRASFRRFTRYRISSQSTGTVSLNKPPPLADTANIHRNHTAVGSIGQLITHFVMY
jgi:uncharacterized protein (DUF58 family)